MTAITVMVSITVKRRVVLNAQGVWREAEQHPLATHRHEQARHAADGRQHQALTEQLTHKLQTSRAERAADGEFLAPGRAANQQQV